MRADLEALMGELEDSDIPTMPKRKPGGIASLKLDAETSVTVWDDGDVEWYGHLNWQALDIIRKHITGGK